MYVDRSQIEPLFLHHVVPGDIVFIKKMDWELEYAVFAQEYDLYDLTPTFVEPAVFVCRLNGTVKVFTSEGLKTIIDLRTRVQTLMPRQRG